MKAPFTGRLFRIVIPVPDLSAGREFYRVLLGVEGQAVSAGRVYFHLGAAILCVYHPETDGDAGPATPLSVPMYIAVDDIEMIHARATVLSATEPIQTQPWGERSFYLDDPFGNRICFVQDGTEFTGGAPVRLEGPL
jgi:catechol 2,3-dioxygenase-like lactoylglutathione lyase family enzyme